MTPAVATGIPMPRKSDKMLVSGGAPCALATRANRGLCDRAQHARVELEVAARTDGKKQSTEQKGTLHELQRSRCAANSMAISVFIRDITQPSARRSGNWYG
eukprot:6174852-Pleurochrysis_carterae.AAC.5